MNLRKKLSDSKPLLKPLKTWRRYLLLETENASTSKKLQNALEIIKKQELEIQQIGNKLRQTLFFTFDNGDLKDKANKQDFSRFLTSLKIKKSDIHFDRIGSKNDGGYLVPRLKSKFDLLISGGLAQNIDFETEFAQSGSKVIAADFSIAKLPKQHPNITFLPKYVGEKTSLNTLSIDDLSEEALKKARQPILKLDIEGSEWKALLSASSLNQFAVLVVEFHWLEETSGAAALHTAMSVFQKILHQFELVHVHANNFAPNVQLHDVLLPSVFEATFLNKRCVTEAVLVPEGSERPDSPNNPSYPELPLEDFWFAE